MENFMNKLNLNHLFICSLVLGCSFSLIACNDDEEDAPIPPQEVTTAVMYGDYTGKLFVTTNETSPVDEIESNEEDEENTGTEISAKVENETISLEQFPIKDIVLSIVGDEETANTIVEAVGDVNYQLSYEPAFNEAKDSIWITLAPEPLKLSLTLPAETESEEVSTLNIEVKVEPLDGANYELESTNLKFQIIASEVLLGEGEQQSALPGFMPINLDFKMQKNKP